MDTGYNKTSFLDQLLTKQAMALGLKEQGVKVEAALAEVQRQIKQASHGNIITGEGVTKSGEDD